MAGPDALQSQIADHVDFGELVFAVNFSPPSDSYEYKAVVKNAKGGSYLDGGLVLLVALNGTDVATSTDDCSRC